MKTNEFMLGNFASVYPSNMPIKIAAIHKDKVAYRATTKKLEWVKMDLLRPIPITSEILEKNGFRLKSDGWLWCKDFANEEQNYVFIQFRKGTEEVRLCEINFVVNKMQATIRRIKNINELQIIFEFLNIGKEIEL
jgi:hypothetical protein